MLRRLGLDSNHETFKLTIPAEIIESNELEKGTTLYFRCKQGVLSYSWIERDGARKLKLQKSNCWFVHIPRVIIEAYGFKKGQQFEFKNYLHSFTFNPYEYGTKMYEIAKPKKTVNNLPKKESGAIEDLY